ncbi:hypothetical protein [Burkholderia gladioli]|uniref:hypothetical protein n=1 Tax=Burkholderia gladioli TaxID=28095 RepID=UPI00164057B8|nr:hypothetical protein [Burkholderia gladioli]
MDIVFRSVFRSFAVVLVWGLICLDPDKAQLADILHLFHSTRFWTLVDLLALSLFAVEVFSSEIFGAGLVEIPKWLARKFNAVRD